MWTQMFGEARLGRAVSPARFQPLVEEIVYSVSRHPSAPGNIARLKTRDDYTFLHSVAVCVLMINLARQLALPDPVIRACGLAGLLHDVGKLTVPAVLLQKSDALTGAEYAIVRDHAVRGHALLREGRGVGAIALDVALHHHEKYDGSGYPHGLKGKAISLHARMGSICDVYDAITSDRPYKDPWPPALALARMRAWEGHFDPELLEAFIASIGIHPMGTLVRLRSDRLAVVMGGPGGDAMQPLVRAFHSTETRMAIPPQELVIAAGGDDRILGIADPADWGLTPWPALRDALLGPENIRVRAPEPFHVL